MTWYSVCVVLVATSHAVLGIKEPAEKKLHDHLLGDRYSNLIRPTGNSTVKLTVKLGLRLSQLLEIVSICSIYRRSEVRVYYRTTVLSRR